MMAARHRDSVDVEFVLMGPRATLDKNCLSLVRSHTTRKKNEDKHAQGKVGSNSGGKHDASRIWKTSFDISSYADSS